MMQAKYYAITAMVTAAVAMSAQAQTTTPTQVNTPNASETQSGQVPDTQPGLATQPGTIIIVEKAPPGVTTAATREDVRAETLSEMKAGHIPRGEQSTATQGSKPDHVGSEMLWQR